MSHKNTKYIQVETTNISAHKLYLTDVNDVPQRALRVR